MTRRPAAAAALAIMAVVFFLAAAPARAEDCTGLLPFADCTLDQDTTAPLDIDHNVVLTVSAGGLSAPLVIGDAINSRTTVANSTLTTAGNGGTIVQEADIGAIPNRRITTVTIGSGDIWYLSGNATLDAEKAINMNGSIFGIGPDSALSIVSAGILGGAGNDILDYISGGVSYGTTGTIGRAGQNIDLGDGDNRFLYYQSAGSTIEADNIFFGSGSNLLGFFGTSTGALFSGNIVGGGGAESIVFISGSTAQLGGGATQIYLAGGNDVVDFDSGGGTAGGIIDADTLDLGSGDDLLNLAGNAQLTVRTDFTGGTGNDTVVFTSGGFFDASGAAFTMGDGDDTLLFTSTAYQAGVSGLDVSGGSFTMGAGNDTVIFTSYGVGLNATGTLISLGEGDDVITFISSPAGILNFSSGAGFLSVNGGNGDDALYFGSAAAVFFGDAAAGGAIAGVETLDGGGGSLTYYGTIDSAATLLNFTSASFLGPGTAIMAYVSGGAAADTLTFASGAVLSGTVETGTGNDAVSFSSASLDEAGSIDLGAGDDSFTATEDTVIAGTVDGGGDTNDTLAFLAGDTTLTGSIVGFASGQVMSGATLTVRDQGMFAVDLYGAGTVRFGSAGSAEDFTLGATLDGVALDVAGGTLDTDGVDLGTGTPLRGLSVGTGALLLADSAIDAGDGAVDANGTLAVAGTLRMTPRASISADAYDTTDPGTFIFEVGRSGGVTQVGSITLETAQNLDFLTPGDTFRFVRQVGSDALASDSIVFASTQPGGTVTAPGTVLGSTILYDIALSNPSPELLQLDITQTNTVEGLTDTANNAVIGGVILGDLLNSTDSSVNAIQSALLNADGPGQFNRELEAASPPVDDSGIAGMRMMSRQTFGLINQRLAMLRKDEDGATGISTGNLTKELEAWWQFYAVSANQAKRTGIPGYSQTTYGLAGGVDKELFDDAFFGLSFSWGQSAATVKGPGDPDSSGDSYGVSAYADYDFGRAYINAMVSAAYGDMGTSKSSAAGKRSGNFHAAAYAVRGEIGYSFMPGKTRLIPYIMGQYGYYSPSAYTEEGPGAQAIQANNITSMEAGAGLVMNWLIRNDGASYFVPEMRLGYTHDFTSDPVSAQTRFVAGGPVFTIQGADPARDVVDLGLGLTYFSKEAWELLFRYDMEYKADYLSHAGMIRAAYKFY